MAKLRSMTETIKMLSTENVSLREENDGLLEMQGNTAGSACAPLLCVFATCVPRG